MKRNPPAGNVRRVQAIGDNLRHTLTSKTCRTIQCESFNEYKLVLCLERDKTVKDYLSQPETLEYISQDGSSHRYTPDFKVWRTNERIEIHEVTLEERAEKRARQPERERATRQWCEERGWMYQLHTEQTLPSGTALANLQFLFGYRPGIYANPTIQEAASNMLALTSKLSLTSLVERLCDELVLNPADVIPALLHLLWTQGLSTDMDRLLCLDGALNPLSQAWLLK